MQFVPLRKYHEDGELPTEPHEIFVFGSNLAGIHGKGAAKVAMEQFNAAWGVPEGLMGMSYAIPTKDGRLRALSFFDVSVGVDKFVEFTKKHPETSFFVTAVGCGYARFTADRIAPLFRGAINCSFPSQWQLYLEQTDPVGE